MADEIYDSASSKPHTPPTEAASNRANNPSKFYNHFLYKAAFITVFLVLLPLLPCEVINESVYARSWELLQLIFVGIAVSYGLFSKKNDGVEKDNGSKLDNAQSYVSKLLQVSSVFDDESENQTVIDENRVQTWNSQYYREEPVVVVAKGSSEIIEENGVTMGISQKPLLLPVRSLRQRVPEPNEIDLVNDSCGRNAFSRSISNSGSKRFSANLSIPRTGEFGGRSSEKLEEKVEDNVVLRSPIPWRSRSGRMEFEENGDSPEFRLDTKYFKPNPSSKSLSPSPSLSSPQKLSNSASFSMESQAKSSEEDVVRKKKLSSPPPPPPPPPFPQSYLKKSNSSMMNTSVSSEKEFRRSVISVPTKELSDNEVDEVAKRKIFSSETRGRVVNDGPSKSVRAFRSGEPAEFVEEKGYSDSMINEKIPTEENNELLEKILMETSDEDLNAESEDDSFMGSSGKGEVAVNDENVNDPGPDVDKKADEFIAKFREQIRLQRINSFRRSAADHVLKT